MSKLNYFLITDMCRDGDHEYYDYVAVETKMTRKQIDDNKNFWEECFLAWQFGWIQQEYDDDWWADNRIVRIDGIRTITKEQFEVLDDVTGGWSLEKIIEQGEGDWTPSDENLEHYGLRNSE